MATVPAGLPERVTIRDVGPRDGLQPEAPVPVADRIRLVDALAAAGLATIEAAAFVSPKAVPAMAGAGEVLAGIDRRPGVTYVALVPNLRGAELALAAGVDALTVTISASETYNRRNVGMGTDDSVAVIADIAALAAGGGPGGGPMAVDAVISCSFGSPYEGEVAPAAVADLAERVRAAGATTATYADTTGTATPRRIHDLLDALDAAALARDVGLHLHDTRGTALVNAYAGLERGVARFDTAVGGLGGSPFAAGAGGNLATESLVHLLDDLGIATGIDLDRLLDAAAVLRDLVGRDLPSPILTHGPRTRRA